MVECTDLMLYESEILRRSRGPVRCQELRTVLFPLSNAPVNKRKHAV